MKRVFNRVKNSHTISIILIAALYLVIPAILFFSRSDKIEIVEETININTVNGLVELLLSNILTFAGIWIACYLLFIQMYKDRYPMQNAKKNFMRSVIRNLTGIVICMIWGSIIIILDSNIIEQIYYIMMVIATIILVFYDTYSLHNKLVLNPYIEECVKLINNNTLSNIKNPSELKGDLLKLKNTFCNAMTSEEYDVCITIDEQESLIFEQLIKESSPLLVDNIAEIGELEECYNLIIKYLVQHVYMLKNCSSEYTLQQIVYKQFDNLFLCVKTNNMVVYKYYNEMLVALLYKMQLEKKDNVAGYIYSQYEEIIDHITELGEDYFEYNKIAIESLSDFISVFCYMKQDLNIKYYIDMIIEQLIKNEDGILHQLLLSKFMQISLEISQLSNKIGDVIFYYAKYSNHLLTQKKEKEIEEYVDIISRMMVSCIENERWLEYCYYMFDSIQKETLFSNRLKDKVLDISIEYSSCMIYNKIYYPGISYPELNKLLFIESKINTNIEDKLISNWKDMSNLCLINSQERFLNELLIDVSKSLYKIDKKEKNVQLKIFDIFISVFSYLAVINNEELTELSFYRLEKCIRGMDERNNMSIEFCDYLVKNIEKVATIGDNNEKVPHASIKVLFGFIDKDNGLNFFYKYKEKKKILYKSLFQIGVSAIENTHEDILRKVSNALGWMAKNCIDNKDKELTKYLIERAEDLYQISSNMEISKATKIFLLTLFTTLGIYCCKDNALILYRNLIVDCLENVPLDDIKTAISIRTKENDTWDNIFNNKTDDLTKRFLAQIEKNQKKRNVI